MELISDIFLIAGTLGAGFYCAILGKRLKKFNDLETGVGGAVTVLSTHVEDLQVSIENADKRASETAELLTNLAVRADEAARNLELQIASIHDYSTPQVYEPSEKPNDLPGKMENLMFARRYGSNNAEEEVTKI